MDQQPKKKKLVDKLIIITAIADGILLALLLANLLFFSCNRGAEIPGEAIEDSYSDEDTDLVEIAEEIGQSGDLKITLLWDFPADIDLHVIQPNGKEINYSHLIDLRTGGNLDMDNTDGGQGSAENIYWRDPPSGDYKVYIHYYSEKGNVPAPSGQCTVIILQKDRTPKKYVATMSRVNQLANITTITIN